MYLHMDAIHRLVRGRDAAAGSGRGEMLDSVSVGRATTLPTVFPMEAYVTHDPRRGTELTCKNWLHRGGLPHAPEQPGPGGRATLNTSIVYGGRKVARNWACFDAILESPCATWSRTRRCSSSPAKPVAIFRTHEDAPVVLIANSNIVPHWATQANFDRWEAEGLIMFGQMTAGAGFTSAHRAFCRARTRRSAAWHGRKAGARSRASWC